MVAFSAPFSFFFFFFLFLLCFFLFFLFFFLFFFFFFFFFVFLFLFFFFFFLLVLVWSAAFASFLDVDKKQKSYSKGIGCSRGVTCVLKTEKNSGFYSFSPKKMNVAMFSFFFGALWVYAGALLRCLVKTRRQRATENCVQTGSWEYPRKMGTCCFWHRQAQPKGTKSGKKSTKSGKSGTKSGKRGTKSCKKKTYG